MLISKISKIVMLAILLLYHSNIANAAGGHILSQANTNATVILNPNGTPAHQLTFLLVITTSSSAADLRFFDKATTPACTEPVLWNVPIAANTTSPGVAIPVPGVGLQATNGLAFCLTGTNADNDTSASVTGININWIAN